MRDFLVILRRNFVSPIVIAILVLATILLILNERRDAWFLSFVIVVNTIFAVVQEVRAQRALKKLELMSAPRARRIADDGTMIEVMFDTLIVGDMIRLQSGDEVPADGEVIETSGLEADESMLTGESAAVEKTKGAVVYAASAIVAGVATVRVTAVGDASKAGVMTATLKRYKPQQTPLQRSIMRAITWLTYSALGLAALIFTVYFLAGQDSIRIFKTITSAAVTVVPEGLLLASSLLLAFGSLRLAQAKVLPQKLAAIEAMALLNVLCVDKTGTLTSDEVTLETIDVIKGDEQHTKDLIALIASKTSSGNATGDAILAATSAPKGYEILDTLAFSSERKMSGLRVRKGSIVETLFMGAPEFLTVLAPMTAAQKKRVSVLASQGSRVLLVAAFDNTNTPLKKLTPGSGYPVALIVLSNQLRTGVTKTVAYLQKNGVDIRVISGDNPQTVAYIAAKAGINYADRVITGAELELLDTTQWDETVLETTIFARVLPEQKERLIATFKRHGNFTGMVGDGVNDALALKKADLGVAMFAGAAATRRVADIVLLNNSFNSLPMGMRLGNRIMQAIEIIATLFFHKIIYGVVLLLSTLALGIVYPFEPRHITFMNIFLVTMPTLMWTLFPPLPRHRLSPKYFWRDTVQAVAPIAVISGLVVATTYAVLTSIHPHDPHGVSTTTVLVATAFGIYLVFLVPRMFDVIANRTTRLARLLYILGIIVVLTPSLAFSFTRDFFDFAAPAWQNVWPLLMLIIAAAILQWRIAKQAGRRLKQREP